MPRDAVSYNGLGIIGLILPVGGHWIRMASPTEGAFVGTGQGRCALHTSMRVDAIEGVFVALALAHQGTLGPTALLDGTVATNQPVALPGTARQVCDPGGQPYPAQDTTRVHWTLLQAILVGDRM